MNFDFSDDIKAMAAEVRRALERTCNMAEVRRCLEDGMFRPGGLISKPAWGVLAEMGVTGARIPEQWGGSGLGMLELAACAEEIGRACAPVPSLPSVYLATEALLHSGTDSQRERWLPQLARGEAVGSMCFAPIDADGERLTARYEAVPSGAVADFLVVMSADDCAVLIDLNQDGVSRHPLRVLDPGSPMAELTLNAVRSEPMNCPAGSYQGIRNRAAVLLAFEQLGGASRALDIARDYTLQRKTFGRTVASYQAVKHLMADIWAKNEIARGHAYHGAWASETNDPALPLAAACARVSASEAFEFAAQEALQLHGGIGFTWEADIHPFYKRSRSTALSLGSSREWKRRIAQLLHRQHMTIAHEL
jgi:alkylation response protein AidB-like acyl-CoA dehydrogenase